MKVSLFAYSNKGCELMKKLAALFPLSTCYANEKFADGTFILPVESTCKKAQEVFLTSDAIIFVGACGIAVRAIAPMVKNKMEDPAVLVIDELGNHVIPILSGHIGGANQLALTIAKEIDAEPVITTATDINHRFSVDSFAVQNDLKLSSMKVAREISSEILTHDLPICSDFSLPTPLPTGLYDGKSGELGIYLTYTKGQPFQTTLRLIPRVLHVGIGCKKGTKAEDILQLLLRVFEESSLDLLAIKEFASIDVKAGEAGLLQMAETFKKPIQFYTAQELNAIEGTFTPSAFVSQTVGTDNVCERSAAKAANSLNFVVRKTCAHGITIAIAVSDWKI